MASSEDKLADGLIERMRSALEAETRRCFELQKQLDRSNADFEEFMSMAAHNLRESLRDVAAFSQLMTETYAGRLDSDAGVFLEQIRQGTARMQALLADVVDYWATGAAERQPSRTDMEAVLRQALLYLDQQVAQRGAIVTHDRLPHVLGEFALLTKVLRHLIGNAIAYCDAPRARVHVSAARVNQEWVFSVQDNGPGIEPEFQERIFAVFQRLHGKDHPGNGLGLAFCRKAIAELHGRLWMKSTPGAGSTFYFALPAADQ